MGKISQEALDKRIKLHERWLEDKGGECLDLSFCDLRCLDISCRLLDVANFEGSNLAKANLEGSWFNEANFKGANFMGASLRGTSLEWTDCSGACFSDAIFEMTHFRNAILKGAIGLPPAPIIENIDKKLLKILEDEENSLGMRDWDTCKATFCRAELYVLLAGEEGKKLEDKYGPYIAGTLIFHESYPNRRIPDWHADNEETLEDIRRNANEKD